MAHPPMSPRPSGPGRRALLAGLAALPLPAAASSRLAGALAERAVSRGPVLWSASFDPAATARLIAVFNRDWPHIEVVVGPVATSEALGIAFSGGTPPALVTAGATHIHRLDQRGMLLPTNWTALGIDPRVPHSNQILTVAASLGVLAWNRLRVSNSSAPTRLDDLLAERWSGRVGLSRNASLLASRTRRAGVAPTRAWLRQILTHQPRLYDSPDDLAAGLAGNEIDVAYAPRHSIAAATINDATINMAFTRRVALDSTYAGVIKGAPNSEGAQILAAWLATLPGATALDSVVGSGNPYVTGSAAAAGVVGRDLSEYPIAALGDYLSILSEFNHMLDPAIPGSTANPAMERAP